MFHLLFLALNTNWAGYPIKVSPFGNITEIYDEQPFIPLYNFNKYLLGKYVISISDVLRPGLVRRFWIAIWKGKLVSNKLKTVYRNVKAQ